MSNTNTELAKLQAQINALLAENIALKQSKVKSPRGLSLKVSEKGAVSVYGMARFPTTLYKEQWLKLLGSAEEIKAFILANDSMLTSKADKVAAQAQVTA